MKKWIHATSTRTQSNWIDRESIEDNEYFDITGEDMEYLWSAYLADPEDKVNKELQIFPEPSVQGGYGGVFIYDESGQHRWRSSDKTIDWFDWCEHELELALESSNAEEYAQKYKAWMKSHLGI